MINITSLKQYMFCPLIIYYQETIGNDNKNEFLINNEIKSLRIDIQDLMQKNMRKITINMEIDEIENILLENIISYIDNTFTNLKNSMKESLNEKIDKMKKNLISEIYFNIKITALKSKKAMGTLEADGNQIVEIFFPNSMHTYLLKDSELEIVGVCDKIEIIDGTYYPVQTKTNKPPIKGVWDSDAIELVANAILIEQEFDTEVFVGFIDYIQIKERRPVVMDVHIRKSLFKILKEIKTIKKEEIMPKIKRNKQKCLKCNYNEICKESID